MLTLNQILGQLHESFNIDSDDTIFSDRYLIDLVNQARAVFLRQDLNKGRTADPTIIQELPCVELEIVDAVLCSGLDFPGGCKLLRSKAKIPDTIELHHNDGILSVRPVQLLSSPFSYVDYKRIPYIKYSRFGGNMIYGFLLDGYMYVYSPCNTKYLMLETIHIRGIFEDPTEAGNFLNETGEPCFTKDSPYPIATWMFESAVKPHVLQQMAFKLQIPDDKDNNADDDSLNGGSPRMPQPSRQQPQQQVEE